AAYDANGNEIDALPYTITKTLNGVTATIPKAALDIIASWGAATINSYFPIGMETDTTLEQFAGEFLLWGVTEYMPILSGTEDSSTGSMTGAGVWKDVLNVYINAVYSNFSTRTYKENANFDAVYDLIDDTLFTLIPASWIPSCSGSFDLVNSMLFETISNFDLQGILGILSVNNSADAELGLPVMTVLLRVIDRVLAIVFNDNGLLLPVGRAHVTRDQKLTSITTLGGLLDATGTSASLPTLLYNIIDYFHTYQTEILGTALPLLVAQSYERPYDEAYLGSKGITTYKVADLDTYINYFTDNINAEVVTVLDNKDDAKAAVDGNTQAVKTLDGSKYELRLSNGTVYGTYATLEEAMAVQDVLKDAYYVENVVDETTTTYTIYARKSYMTSATAAAANDADGETWGEYNTYSGFKKATLTNRTESNPLVSYDSAYRFYGYEDFGSASYVYRNVKTARQDAETFVSTYKSFATSDLPAAYHEWMMFSINGRLKAADLYDSNDDGRSVLSDTDSDYVASTDTDPGYPVDGTPGVPEAMYPFSTTDATTFTYYDNKIGENITVYMNSFTPAGFEQLALALEYASDSNNDVTLSVRETEALVRLAINSLVFDITPKTNDDGTEYYNEGSIQWDGLSEAQIFLIDSFCSSNGYTHETVTAEDGTVTHVIKHKAFALLDSSFSLGLANLSSTPVTDISSIKAKTMNSITDEDERTLTVHKAYADYINALTANRRSLYNKIDYISYRYEVAEANRSKAVDTTMLSWALNHYADTYKDSESGLRNLRYTGNVDETTGKAERVKVYTTTSYAKFRNAYDFAQSVFDAAKASVQAEDQLTQSLVTAAYMGIIDAWRQLKPFEGFADWTQLNAYIALAQEILDDPNKDDPVLGYESGLDVLETSLDNALYLKSDSENIDSERQTEIDANAAALKQAIGLLVYKSVPKVIPSESGETEGISTVEIKNENNYIIGHIIGLTEGVGINEAFNEDLITVVGMREDSGSGTEVVKARSGHGYGTGAYYMGKVANQDRFRYYAVLYGDINGDTRIDGTDASALELYILQGKNNTSGMGYARSEAGDINRDGAVDPQDVQSVIDHYTLKESIDQKAHS
ncbi:MAG: dockerin type I domain-containing protein, partial [Acutalibacteraceae bacterium]